MPHPSHAMDMTGETDNPFPRCFHQKMGQSIVRSLGDAFDLTAFGVNLEVIKPQGSSGLSHWHRRSQEFVYVLTGELTLYYGEDTFIMTAGMCMGFKEHEEKGHRLVNHSDQDASFLVIGSRVDGDEAVYDQDDMSWQVMDDGRWQATRKNGEPYSE